MCPTISDIAQLAYERPLRRPQSLAKDRVPLIPQGQQKRVRIPLRIICGADELQLAGCHGSPRFLEPTLLIRVLKLALDKRPQSGGEKLQRLSNSFVVRDRHRVMTRANPV